MAKEPDNPFAIGLLAIFSGEVMGAFWPAWRFLTMAGVCLIVWCLVPSERRRMQKIFKRTGLFMHDDDRDDLPLILAEEEIANGKEYVIRQPAGLCSNDWRRKEQALSEALGGKAETRFEHGRIRLRLLTSDLRTHYPFQPVELEGLSIPIGHSADGFQVFRFGDARANLLVGGITGSGKSSFLRQALCSLALSKTPQEVRLFLVDLKGGIEFAAFRDLPHVTAFAKSETEAEELFAYLDDTMAQRFSMFAGAGVVGMGEYTRRRGPLPYCLTIIDEFAELRGNAEVQGRIDRLLRQGRAVGMHHILCTQRPSLTDRTMSGSVRANIAATLAFNCRDEVNSRILLGNDLAVRLNIPGRAIFQTDRDRLVQVPYLTVDEVGELLAPILRPKPKTKKRPEGAVDLAHYKRQRGH